MDERLKLAIDRIGQALNEVDCGYGHFITGDNLKIMDVQMLYDAHSVIAGKVAELEEAMERIKQFALVGEGPGFDLILSVIDAALALIQNAEVSRAIAFGTVAGPASPNPSPSPAAGR